MFSEEQGELFGNEKFLTYGEKVNIEYWISDIFPTECVYV